MGLQNAARAIENEEQALGARRCGDGATWQSPCAITGECGNGHSGARKRSGLEAEAMAEHASAFARRLRRPSQTAMKRDRWPADRRQQEHEKGDIFARCTREGLRDPCSEINALEAGADDHGKTGI